MPRSDRAEIGAQLLGATLRLLERREMPASRWLGHPNRVGGPLEPRVLVAGGHNHIVVGDGRWRKEAGL